jgi:hypothetical protein
MVQKNVVTPSPGQEMKAVRSSETSVKFYRPTRDHIPEECSVMFPLEIVAIFSRVHNTL